MVSPYGTERDRTVVPSVEGLETPPPWLTLGSPEHVPETMLGRPKLHLEKPDQSGLLVC